MNQLKNSQKIFLPAIMLMNKFRYPQKFALISTTIIFLVGTILYLLLTNIQTQADFVIKELQGVEYINSLTTFFLDVEEHKYKTDLYLKGNLSKLQQINELNANIDKDMKAVDKVDNKLNKILLVDNKWQDIKDKWNNSVNNSLNLSYRQSYTEHTELINDILGLISHITDKSNLIMDPSCETYYLIVSYSIDSPNIIDKINNAMIEGTNVIKFGNYNKTDFIRMSALVDKYNEELKTNSQKNAESSKIHNAANTSYNANKEFLTLMNDLIDGSNKITVSKFISKGTKAIANDKKAYNTYSYNLYRLLDERIKVYAYQKLLAVFFTLLILLVIGYLFMGFYLSLINSLKSLETSSLQITNGDLTAKVSIDTNDEIADLAKIFNKMAESLKDNEIFIKQQQQSLLELSTPVIKLGKGILFLPIVGILDSTRAIQLTEGLLEKIDQTGSTVAIIDVTGVTSLDTVVVQNLLKTITAAKLMGTNCIISGIRPSIAQTITHLGINMPDVITKATLAEAFSLAVTEVEVKTSNNIE